MVESILVQFMATTWEPFTIEVKVLANPDFKKNKQLSVCRSVDDDDCRTAREGEEERGALMMSSRMCSQPERQTCKQAGMHTVY